MQTRNKKITGYSVYPGESIPNQKKGGTTTEKLSQSRMGSGSKSHRDKILETSEYYQIELVTPGLEREDFFVNINEKGNLSVSALHKDSSGMEKKKYRNRSSKNVHFNQEFLIPQNFDTDFMKAEYRGGILSFCFLKNEFPHQNKASRIIVY
jgi:HSP20 family molecular chaperone IbpA